MQYQIKQINALKFAGVSVRTTNENRQAEQDIPKLWEKFMIENIKQQIPNRINDEVLALYTDYEDDYMNLCHNYIVRFEDLLGE